MEEAGSKKSNIKHFQFWQQHNKPIELYSNHVIDRNLDYLHNNPVEAGFIIEAYHWKYSSAGDYAGIKGEVDVSLME